MLRAGNCGAKIPGADTVKNRLIARVGHVEDENTKLFANQLLIVIVSLDG
jgi:hypothetical protein